MTATDLQLRVSADPDRDARAVARAHPKFAEARRTSRLCGAILAVTGSLVVVTSPVMGVPFIALGVIFLLGGLQRLQVRGLRRAFAGAGDGDWPLTIDVTEQGVRWTTPRSSVEHNWSVFDHSIEHHDGILLAHAGGRQVSWIARRGCDEWRWHELTGLVAGKTARPSAN